MLKPAGTNLLGLCPFHDDHTPSLSIDPAKNLWHCLGACQQGGSVIDWVMKARGVSFREAVEVLRAEVVGSELQVSGSTPPLPSPTDRLAKSPRVTPAPLPATAAAQQWAQYVMEAYHMTLQEHAPEAKAYLAKRGLLNEELIETFKLGFANRAGCHCWLAQQCALSVDTRIVVGNRGRC